MKEQQKKKKTKEKKENKNEEEAKVEVADTKDEEESKEADGGEESEVPEHFLCPITQEIMARHTQHLPPAHHRTHTRTTRDRTQGTH